MIASWIPVAALFIIAMFALFIVFIISANYVSLADKYAKVSADYRWAAQVIATWNMNEDKKQE